MTFEQTLGGEGVKRRAFLAERGDSQCPRPTAGSGLECVGAAGGQGARKESLKGRGVGHEGPEEMRQETEKLLYVLWLLLRKRKAIVGF